MITDTSKYPPRPDLHGKNGVFLASVASLSLLSIASHHRGFHSHNSLSIHNSKILTRHTPCPPQQRVLTFSHGTRITVRDLFGSMPVRVKHRALQAEKSSFAREWDRLTLDVVALLIAWPGTVSVALRETSGRWGVTLRTNTQSRKKIDNGCQLLHQASLCNTPSSSEWVALGASAPTLAISGYVCRDPAATKSVQFLSFGIEPLSNELRSNVLYEEINKVFAESRFGVIENESDKHSPAETATKDGFLSKDFKARKGVDRWPMFFLQVTPTSASGSCLKVDDVLDNRRPDLSLITDLLKAMFHEFLRKNHCRPKAVTLSTKSDDRTPNSQGRSNTPDLESPASSLQLSRQHRTDFVQAATNSVAPRGQSISRRDASESRPVSPFAAWSKVKSGQVIQNPKAMGLPRSETLSLRTNPTIEAASITKRLRTTAKSSIEAVEGSRSSLYDANGKLTRKPFEDVEIRPQGLTSKHLPQDSMDKDRTAEPTSEVSRDDVIECINPSTGIAVSVDSRTGCSAASKALTLSRRAFGKGAQPGCDSVENDASSSNTQSWVEDLVSKWKNPVFELREEPILKLPDVTESLAQDVKSARYHSNCGQGSINMGTRFEASSLALAGRLSKLTLGKAEVVAQVDQKFIFAKMPLNHVNKQPEMHDDGLVSSPGLLLIDQHAADERCRVEQLMAGYFKLKPDSTGELCWQADTANLPKPVHFELPLQEEGILHRSQQYFSYWGIAYDIEVAVSATRSEVTRQGSGNHHNKVRLTVTRLPPAILERCRTEPRLLAELIRKEAWRLKDEGRNFPLPRARPVSAGKAEEDVPIWVSLLHGCPPGILDLINSRSCRSKYLAFFYVSAFCLPRRQGYCIVRKAYH